MSNRITGGGGKFEIIDEFGTEVTLNTAAVSSGFHVVHEYRNASMNPRNVYVQYYTRSDIPIDFVPADEMYEAPGGVPYSTSGGSSTIDVFAKINDGVIQFGYQATGLTVTTPTVASFQGFVFKV